MKNHDRSHGRPAERALRRAAVTSLAVAALMLAACSSDSASTAATSASKFAVTGTSVVDGTVWKLNRPIDVHFNQDVDFDTVSGSTLQIVDNQGAPAIGAWSLVTPSRVRFQPRCPTDDANSNGGLKQGRTYRLTVPSESSPGLGGGVTVQDTAGNRLRTGLHLTFTTPTSDDPLVLFIDPVAGPPLVRVRGLNGEPLGSERASYVEFGGDPDNVEYFVFDSFQNPPQGRITSAVPLNLYSRTADQFDIVLRFNQPVNASSSNINSSLIGLEYERTEFQWERVPSTVTIEENCTAAGASVRLEPLGIVPQGSPMRVFVEEGFRDLVGQRVLSTSSTFARFDTQVADPTTGSTDGSDEILERFSIEGGLAGSLEDTTVASAVPRADWSGVRSPGALSASFDFDGSGGPLGDFDWVVRAGETIVLNTDGDMIRGGPDGNPFFNLPVSNGLIDIDDMHVQAGGKVIFVGSHTATILATGDVIIEGSVSLNGGDAQSIVTLDTTDQPEDGASGHAGGGAGGTASFFTSQSTPRGGAGHGAFDLPGLGGEGGESSYSLGGKERRRGAGGGGGRLGRDVRYPFPHEFTFMPTLYRCQTLIGMDAEPGFPGSLDGTGAVTGATFAQGGAMAPFPFSDASDENDFFGAMLTNDGRQVLGELPSVWAGSGGGAGGDAVMSATFPLTPFDRTGDEKGCGGGGGAGGIMILAIGNIEIRGNGELTADGGYGGGGENTSFFDRVGGGSGGGSGGHIILSSASQVIIDSEVDGEFAANPRPARPFYDDVHTASTHDERPLRALGGQGGAGRQSMCGADHRMETTWRGDAVPLEYFESNPNIPIQNSSTWQDCNVIGAAPGLTAPPEGTVLGGGGDGGPGIIQIHVADAQSQLLFPQRSGTYGVDLDPTFSMAPPPLGWRYPNSVLDPSATDAFNADVMVPFFGARSEAYSKWIPLGLARFDPDAPGTPDQLEFLFGGTDTNGDVPRAGTVADDLPPIFPLVTMVGDPEFVALSTSGGAPSFDIASGSFRIPATGVDSLYLDNPSLLRHFAVRVQEQGDETSRIELTVADATLDASANELTLVANEDAVLFDTVLGMSQPEVQVVPFFYRLMTDGVMDTYPLDTSVRILFDAAEATDAGEPNLDLSVSGGDPTAFVASLPTTVDAFGTVRDAQWDFVRFKVEFDLDTDESDDETAVGRMRPGLDYLRIPYRF